MKVSFVLAMLALVLIPFVPNLLRLRISVLRLLHWRWAVDIHEKYFTGLVITVRVLLLLVAAVLLYFDS